MDEWSCLNSPFWSLISHKLQALPYGCPLPYEYNNSAKCSIFIFLCLINSLTFISTLGIFRNNPNPIQMPLIAPFITLKRLNKLNNKSCHKLIIFVILNIVTQCSEEIFCKSIPDDILLDGGFWKNYCHSADSRWNCNNVSFLSFFCNGAIFLILKNLALIDNIHVLWNF